MQDHLIKKFRERIDENKEQIKTEIELMEISINHKLDRIEKVIENQARENLLALEQGIEKIKRTCITISKNVEKVQKELRDRIKV